MYSLIKMEQKQIFKYLAFLFIWVLVPGFNGPVNQEEMKSTGYNFLKENFKNPPYEYGLNCWWWWLNSNVTKEAIKIGRAHV